MRYASTKVYTWKPDIAYCVGLITSDGCLQKDGRHLDLTSVDRDQLLNFCRAIGRDFYIGTKRSGNGALAYRIQFSDVTFYDFLIKTGLAPAKSHTIGALNIPAEYYADFLRGLFDGDGTVYGFQDHRWRNSYMYYCGFVSASPNFLLWLQYSNNQLLGVGNGYIHRNNKAQTLVYAKQDSRKLFNMMYANAELPKLNRKYLKFKYFIESDPHVKITPIADVVE